VRELQADVVGATGNGDQFNEECNQLAQAQANTAAATENT
jgi:hypothetical protein